MLLPPLPADAALFGPRELATSALLAAVTLLEGMRRVPAGSVVLQRFLFGPWRVRTVPGGFRLLSWWSPLMTTLLLPPGGANGGEEVAAVRSRLAAVRRLLLALRILGLALVPVIVLGIPIAAGRFGGTGFLLALAATGVLCLAVFAVACRAAGLRWSLRFLSPFAAPRAAEVLLEDVVRALPSGVAARLMLRSETFLEWIRPHVYDRMHGGQENGPALLAGLEIADLREPLDRAPSPTLDPGAAFWCPRCGARFVRRSPCSECGIDLVPISSRA